MRSANLLPSGPSASYRWSYVNLRACSDLGEPDLRPLRAPQGPKGALHRDRASSPITATDLIVEGAVGARHLSPRDTAQGGRDLASHSLAAARQPWM